MTEKQRKRKKAEYARISYDKNPKIQKARNEKWKLKNPNFFKEYFKKYRKSPEIKKKLAEYQKKWRLKNPEYKNKYYSKHKEQYKASSARWRYKIKYKI